MADTRLSNESRRAIPWLLWTVWKNRDAIILAGTRDSLVRPVQLAVGEAKLWEELNRSSSSPTLRPSALVLARRWYPPLQAQVKCNIHVNWHNNKLHCGGSWIIRHYQGRVSHHAREAFTSSTERLTVELRVLIWVLQSLRDLHIQELTIGSDLCDPVDEIKRPADWPRYRWILQKVLGLTAAFPMVCFEIVSTASNHVARDIAKSVLRNCLFQSYLALGGPSWLLDCIRQESSFEAI